MIKIVQPLNNNVVMGYDRKKGEVIIIGTGIGFRAKKGDQVDESKIQKMFITGENKQLLEMIGAIPPEYFELVEEIFEKAKEEYGFLPKEKETLALLDHIHFAIKRMKENLVLDNPFETEIRQFYPKEWEIGLYAKKCIKRRFGTTSCFHFGQCVFLPHSGNNTVSSSSFCNKYAPRFFRCQL